MTLPEVSRKEGREESKIEFVRYAMTEGSEPGLVSSIIGYTTVF